MNNNSCACGNLLENWMVKEKWKRNFNLLPLMKQKHIY